MACGRRCLQRMGDETEVRVVFVGLDLKAQAAHELEHAVVVGEHQADDFLQAAAAGPLP